MEDLNSERAASDGADYIYGILLLAYILTPGTEDVTLFIDVSIVLGSTEVSFKADLETSQQAITLGNFLLQTGFKTVSFVILFGLLYFSLFHKCASSVFLLAEILL